MIANCHGLWYLPLWGCSLEVLFQELGSQSRFVYPDWRFLRWLGRHLSGSRSHPFHSLALHYIACMFVSVSKCYKFLSGNQPLQLICTWTTPKKKKLRTSEHRFPVCFQVSLICLITHTRKVAFCVCWELFWFVCMIDFAKHVREPRRWRM